MDYELTARVVIWLYIYNIEIKSEYTETFAELSEVIKKAYDLCPENYSDVCALELDFGGFTEEDRGIVFDLIEINKDTQLNLYLLAVKSIFCYCNTPVSFFISEQLCNFIGVLKYKNL